MRRAEAQIKALFADISRLGLMVVLNQPKTAAEYIQATSRVGRQLSDKPEQNKPGLVLVLLNPNRQRDRSHFELFPYWHQTFYSRRLCEPGVAVEGELIGIEHIDNPETWGSSGSGGRPRPHHLLPRRLPLGQLQVQV